MVQIFCKLCLQSVSATDWKAHIAQKQHLQQLPCKIVVTGSFKDKVDEVYTYFGKFGGIRGQNVTVQEDKIAIEYRFWDARVYSEVIHQEHTLFGQQVEISWFKKVKAGLLQHVVQNEKMSDERFVYSKLAIINTIQALPTFAEQIQMLQKQLKIIKSEMEEHRKTIHDDLTTVLASNFPHNKIHFFGSTITELEIHNSDLNIYVDNTDSQLATLELMKDLITKNENFTNVLLNSENDNSVVKCRHVKSRISCELTIRNELPVGNSEFIKYYLTLDEKLKPLMLFIKFWADCYDLRGENLFSSYALYLMVIFYLQCEPHKLPSVLDLQKDMPSDEIDGWNCAFGPVEFTSPSLENSTILDLVTGFFRFYSNFDYMSHVISPFFGSSIAKTRFLKPHDLPECFDDYVNQNQVFPVNSGICIQDPFEHSRNVSVFVPLECVGKFTAVCRNSLELIQTKEAELFNRLLLAENPVNQFHLEKNEWDEEGIKELVLKIVREIFCCQVEEIKSEEAHVTYSCQGQYNIWDKRSDFLKNIMTELSSEIEQEIAVTSRIIKDSAPNFTWEMGLQLTFDKDKVTFVLKNENFVLLHLGHFLYVKLAKLLTENPSNVDLSRGIPMNTEEVHPVEEKPQIKDQSQAEEISKPTPSGSVKQNLENAVFESSSENAQQANDRSSATNFANENLNGNGSTMNTEEIHPVKEKLQNENQSQADEISKPIPSGSVKQNLENAVVESSSENLQQGNGSSSATNFANENLGAESGVSGSQQPTNRTTKASKEKSQNDLFAILHNVNKDLSFSDQVLALQKLLSLSKETTNDNLKIIKQDLQFTLKSDFPGPIYFYGSAATHLNLKSSNVDICVVSIGKQICFESSVLEEIRNIIYKSAKFSEVYVHKTREEYFLYFRHVETQMCCSLKVNNMLAVKHSELVKHYLSYSDKLPPLVTMIRFWGTHFGLTGPKKLTNYVACLLVIFYLQQKPYNVPPVVALLTKTQKLEGWNCAFLPIHFTNQLVKTATIHELAVGFFRFYGNFDYSKYVIAPYVGSPIDKASFWPPYDLPDCYCKPMVIDGRLPLNSSFCVQDPFEHNKNLLSFSLDYSGKFAALCRNAAKVLTSPEPEMCKLLEEANTHSRMFEISRSKTRNATEWRESVRRLSLKILTDVLGVKDVKINEAIGEGIFCCIGSIPKNIWQNRIDAVKSFLSHLPPDTPEFDKEAALTAHLVQTTPDILYSGVVVNLVFDEHCCTVEVSTPVLGYHIAHAFYVALVKYLAEEDKSANFEEESSLGKVSMDQETRISSGEIEDTSSANVLRSSDQKKIADFGEGRILEEKDSFPASTEAGLSKKNEIEEGNSLIDVDMEGDRESAVAPEVAETIKSCNETSNERPVSYFSSSALDMKILTDVLAETQKAVSFREEITILCDALKLNKSETERNYYVISNDLNLSLRARYPDHSIHFFGSKVSGLALPGSNFDIYVDLKQNVDDEVHTLTLIKNLLTKSEKFREGLVISNCIKCQHVLTKQFCVLNVRKREALSTTNLLEYYLSIDEKLRWLMMLIKLWAHRLDLILLSFSSYSLYLMVIFYLQQEPFGLHSVATLQKDTSKEGQNWNCTFRPVDFTKHFKKFKILTIVAGFFRFYANFDYITYVISPYFGAPIEKSKFLKPYDLPECFHRYLKQNQELALNSGLCIQDPFEHCENVSLTVDLEKSGKFASLCRHASQVMVSRGANLLHQLLADATLLNVQIKKISDETEDEWIGSVKKHTEHILRSVLGCELLQSSDGFEGYQHHNIWDNRINVLKSLLVKSPQMDKDVAVTSYIVTNRQRIQSREIHVKLIFSTNPCVVELEVRGFEEKLHVDHVLYTRLVKLLKNEDDPTESVLEDLQSAIDDRRLFIIQSLAKGQTFAEETAILERKFRRFQTKLERSRKVISEDLSAILIPVFPQIRICFYDTNITCLNMSKKKLKIHLGGVSLQAATLELIKNVIGRNEKFSDVVVTSQCDVVIMCKHVATETFCDLNVQNTLLLSTSDLIKYYMSLDEKLPKLIMIIKFWFDVNVASFPSNAVYLMVIFYLQQEPYKLASVADLQKNVPVDLVDGWNCAFSQVKCENETLQKASLLDLVTGFFRFYESLDYFSCVISPYFGSLIEKTHFLKPYNLPDCYQQYVNQNEEFPVGDCIDIQHPFEHSRNLLESHDFIYQFNLRCRNAFILTQSNKNSLHDLLYRDAENLSLYSIENNKWDQRKWKEFVKVVTVKTLSSFADCTPSETENGEEIIYIGVLRKFWEHRAQAAKNLNLPPKVSDIDKETAITKAVIAQFPSPFSSKVVVRLKFTEHPCRAKFNIRLRKRNKNYIRQFIYVKLLKFCKSMEADADLVDVGESSSNFENLKSTVLENIKSVSTFADQVTILQEKVQTSKAQTEKNYKSIEDDLISALTPFVLKKIFFESRITDLSSQGSNVDIAIDCHPYEVSLLQKLTGLLSKSDTFCDVFVNSEINTIRCRHIKTRQICDLNVSNKFAEKNSELIRQYLSLNDKLRPLLLIIEFWADCYNLTGLYGFSVSAIHMIVIFFLQQKYNLPSVLQLQKTNNHGANPVLQNATILELLSEFFQFYAKFDYISYVISPYCGSAIEKICFLPPYHLPECFQEYVNQDKVLPVDSSFCVQDVHEHYRNISAVPLYLSGRFAALCRASVQLISSDGPELLHNLLSCCQDGVLSFHVEKVDEQQIKDFIFTMLEKVFACKVEMEPKTTHNRYKCEGRFNIWDNRICCLKKLPLSDDSELNKEVAVTARVIEDFPQEHSHKFTVGLKSDCDKLEFSFEKQDFHVITHMCHFVYTRFLKTFTKEATAAPMEVEAAQIVETSATPKAGIGHPKEFIINNIVQAPDFASQAAIFVTKLLHHQTEMAKNHNLISEDLSTLLSPIFPQSKICFYNTDITGLNLAQSNLNIYVADVTQQAATLELIKSMIGKCEKFCDVSQFDAVIRFKHVATKTCCDLNIQSRLPVCTSELIKYYVSLDEKLPKLMMIIKFWFDLYVCGFPNDAVYLMVICYLQHEPYKLPSVADLQKNVPVDLLNGWNCAFSQITYENEPLQEASLLELVTDFFRFYENFDYFSNVISPYFGSVIEKTHFLKPYSVPECYQQYVSQNEELTGEGLVIQDPFKHCENVCEEVSSRIVGSAFFLVRSALKLMEKKTLHLLFLQCHEEISAIFIDFTVENIEKDRETWIQSIRMLTVKVLKEVFCCYVQEKVAIEDGAKVTYLCKANHIWENRVLIAKSLKFSADISELDKEIAITSAVCAQFPFRRVSVIFVELNFKEHPSRVVVSVGRTRRLKFVEQNFFKYFVFLKLFKLLKSDKIEENISTGSENSDNVKQTILDKIRDGLTFTDQVTIFQNTIQAQTEESHKSIEDDLSSALTPSVHLKKIFCESAITSLDVFIDCEEVTLQKMIDLLSKSGNFFDVLANSDFNVIRCRHTKTRKICDLILNTSAENELIGQYLSLNDKLRLVLLVIRFWADCYQLVGFYGFSANAIYMLVIFFLQQKYKLPSVLQLQETNIREFVNPSFQDATILELLSGFFNFYGNFDYISYVISPYFGAAIAKICFLPPYDLPECFQEYVNQNKILPVDSSFCVQDVHDHSKNISSVPLYLSGRFTCFCRNSVHFLASAETNRLDTLLEFGQDRQNVYMLKFQLNINELDRPLVEFTTKIVKEVLKCQLKIDLEDDYMTYHCDEQYNIWNNRLSCFNKLKPLLGSDLDKEIAVTSRVIEDFPLKSSCTFQVKLQSRKVSHAVDVIFLKQTQCPLLLHICHFVYIRYMKFLRSRIAATAIIIEDPAEQRIVSESSEVANVAEIPNIEDSTEVMVTEVKIEYTADERIASENETAELAKIPKIEVKTEDTTEGVIASESGTADFAVIPKIEYSADIASDAKESEMTDFGEVPMAVEAPAAGFDIPKIEVKTEERIASADFAVIPNIEHSDDIASKVKTEATSEQSEVIDLTEEVETSAAGFDIPKIEDTTGGRIVSERETADFAVIPNIEHSADIASEVIIEAAAEQSEIIDLTEVPMAVETSAAGFDNLKEAPTFVEQVVTTLQSILLIDNAKQKQNRVVIQADLVSVLAWAYHRSKIHFFGSSITGVEIPGSDVNIYVSGVKTDDTSEINHLSAIQALLTKSDKFKDVLVIPGTKMKMPVVKCVHCSTLMTCELNIKDKLAVCNSELVKYYLSLGENLRPLLRMIRYWAGCHGMIGENLFSSYALSLMVIFFLQQAPYKVPTVVDLQKNSTDIVDDWNCAFTTPPCTNFLKTSTLDLAKSFFKFYGDFDYFSFVISPFFGSAIAKTRFLQPYTLPGVFRHYMNRQQDLSVDTGICIQDPFEHSKNISASISLDATGKFGALCRCAFQIMQQSEEMLYKLVTPCQDGTLCEFSVIKNDERDEETWIALVDGLISKTLTRVLSCNVYEMRQVDSGVVYGCRGESNVWDNRTTVLKSALKQLHRNTNAVDKEIAVTSRVVNPQKVSWTMSLHKTFNKNPFRVTLTVDTPNNAFYFCHFIYTRLGKFLQSGESISVPLAPLQEKQNVGSEKPVAQNDPSTSKKEESSSASTSSVLSAAAVPPTASTSSEEKEASSSDVVSHPTVIVSSGKNQRSPVQVARRPILDRNQKMNILINAHKNKPTFSAQVAHMYTSFGVDKNEMEKFQKIIHEDLTSALTPNFKFAQIQFFGSTVLGLFTDGSVDVYIDKLEQPATLNLLKDCLCKSDRFRSGTIAASSVTCTHLRSQLSCKIRIDNKLAIHSTQLIEYYLTLDPKLHTFMFTVKAWAEFYQLKTQARLSHYCLCLLAIFYLQQKPYNLPRVADLQKDVPPNMIDGWNGAFIPLHVTSQALKDATMLDLVIGFFKFYSSFNFFLYVISPFYGSAIEKTRFLKPFDLPPCYANYTMGEKVMTVDSSICVQDPFEHSRNVSSWVSLTWAGRFAAMCRSLPDFVSFGEKQLLYKLMTQGQNDQIDHRAFIIEKQEKMDEFIWIRTIKNIISSILTDCLCYRSVNVKQKKVSAGTHLLTLSDSQLSQYKVQSRDIDQILFVCRDQQKLLKNATPFEQNAFVGKAVLEVEAVMMRKPMRMRISVVGAADKWYLTHFFYIKMLPLLEKELLKEQTKKQNVGSEKPDAQNDPSASKKAKSSVLSTASATLSPPVVSASTSAAVIPPPVSSPSAINQGSLFQVVPRVVLDRQQKKNILKKSDLPTFAAQVAHMFTSFRVDKGDIEKYQKIIHEDLTLALTPKFKFGKIHFFGSTVLGLFTVEVYIDKLQQPPTLNLLKDCLCKSGRFLSGSVAASAVNCTNVTTQIHCKIHIHNKLSMYSTQLIEYYLTLDSKLHSFVFTLKTWAEFCHLKSHGGFSNYILHLMAIFYLQQEPYNLPTVADLQRNAPPNMVDGWNGTFVPLHFTNQALKDATMLDLVIGFFKYYSSFNFFSYVISPFCGSAIERIRFLKPFNLPPCYANYTMGNKFMLVNSPLCVQDPFEHFLNVSSLVSLEWVGRFAAMCRSLPALVSFGEKKLLYKLMSQCETDQMIDHQAFIIEKQENMDEFIWIRKIKNVIWSVLTDCYKSVSVQEKRLVTLHKRKLGRKKTQSEDIDKILFICRDQQKLFKNATLFEKNTFGERGVLNVEAVMMRKPTRVKISVGGSADKLLFTHFIYIKMLPMLEQELLKEQTTEPSVSGSRQPTNRATNASKENSPKVVLSEESKPYKCLVKGIRSKPGKVRSYFASLGFVTERVVSEDSGTTIECGCANLTAYLQVRSEHVVYGQKLKLFPLVPLREKQQNAYFASITKEIVMCSTFTAQINVLLGQRADNRTVIQNDLNCALSSKFGATKTYFFDVNVPSDNLEIYVGNIKHPDNRVATLEELTDCVSNAGFGQVSLISNSITCIHVKTQTFCVITFGNKMAEISSDLIKYYLSLDEKIQHFMMIVKFWADSYDLIGVDCFSNYAFSLMVIFFLQQEYNLPAVKTLQANTPVNLVKGWNCAYAEFVEFTNSPIKNAAILELVTGFFKFYSKFDYISYVLSPYWGTALEKIRFLKPYDLPEGFTQFRTYDKDFEATSGLCIQDFFEHSRNVSVSVPLDLMGNFTNLCRSALQLIETGEEFLLYNLLLHCQNDAIVEFPAFILENDDRNEQEWEQAVKKITKMALSDILNCKVYEVASADSKSFSFGCVGQHRVWDNRINIWKTLPTELSHVGIEREAAITNRVIKEFPQSVEWNVSVKLIFMTNPSRAKILFAKMSDSFNVNHVCHFLYTRLVKLLTEEETFVSTGPLIDLTKDDGKISNEDVEPQPRDSPKSNMSISVEEISEDDDVPSDFFDDFAKEDFLMGLDIVDACNKNSKVSSPKEKTKSKRRPREKSVSKEKKRRKKSSKTISPVGRRRRSRTRSRSRSRPRRRTRSRSRSRSRRRSRSRSRDGKRERRDRKKNRTDEPVPPGTENTADIERTKRKRRSTSSSDTDKSRKRCSRSFSRSPSRSPCMIKKMKRKLEFRSRRRSSDSLSPRPKRKSFLEEISEKLNEIKAPVPPPPVIHNLPPYIYGMQPVAAPVPAPIPYPLLATSIPPPAPYYPSVPPPIAQSYDPSFFINGATVSIVTNPILHTAPPLPPPLPPLPPVPPSPPPPPPLSPPSVSVVQQKITSPKPLKPKEKQPKDDAGKLFAQKKISLSDFLSITAKRKAVAKSSSPEHKQEKDKVISRCKDVLNLLTSTRKTGRLSVELDLSSPHQPQPLYQSPLKRTPKVRFSFTTPPKWSVLGDSFSEALTKILQKVGLDKDEEEDDVDDLVDSVARVLNSYGSVSKETAAKILKVTLLGALESEMSESAEKFDVGIQCMVNRESVGVQVHGEEPSPGGLLSDDSIAYVTSAYLLGKNRSTSSNGSFDTGKEGARHPRRRL